jgi:hypothetical protein
MHRAVRHRRPCRALSLPEHACSPSLLQSIQSGPPHDGAYLKFETEGCKNQIALKAVLNVEFMKPPSAKGDFLISGFDRI